MDRFARTWTCVVVLIYGVFSLGGDRLAFSSGWATVVYVGSALATIGALPIWGVGLLGDALVRRIRQRSFARPGRTLMTVLVVALLVSVCGGLTEGLSDGTWLLLLMAASGLCLLAVTRIPSDSAIFHRATRLARVTAALGVAVVLIGFTSNRLAGARPSSPGRAVLLLVIDGFPTELLNTYNPAVPATVFDQVAEEGLVFDRAYTNHVFTAGFFRELYTGELGYDARPPRAGSQPSENLLQSLQRRGAAVEFIVSHQNAVPETHHVTAYSGFRSQLLSERYRAFPQLLGLDYHLFRAVDDTRSGLKRGVPWLHDPLDHPREEARLITTVVPQEFRRLQAKGGNGLLIAHVFAAPPLLDEQVNPSAQGPLAALLQYAHGQEERYLPEHGEGLQQLRAIYRERLDFWGGQLKALLAELRSSGSLDDALVIVTADHGTSLSGGRLRYVYHALEPVTRVPLVMFGAGVDPGRVPAVVDTRDLAHTLAAQSTGGEVDFAPGGRDLLRWNELRPRVAASMSLPGRRSEVLFSVHTPEDEYLFDLAPDGDGRVLRGPAARFEAPSVPVDTLPAALASEVKNLLAAYGYVEPPTGIHSRVRELVGLGNNG